MSREVIKKEKINERMLRKRKNEDEKSSIVLEMEKAEITIMVLQQIPLSLKSLKWISVPHN